MADFDPPSFSLGLDLDFDPPSFSLGLDFDPDPIVVPPPPNKPPQNEEDVELQLRVSDSDPDDHHPPPPPTLRRLRRGGLPRNHDPGLPHSDPPVVDSINDSDNDKKKKNDIKIDDDDVFGEEDIEEFSSEELAPLDNLPAPQHHSVGSSSKITLSGRGILKSQPDSKALNSKRKQDSVSPPTSSLDARKRHSTFSDLNASPLRRFRLLDSDSDSDDPSESILLNNDVSKVARSQQSERKGSNQGLPQAFCEKKTESSIPVSDKDDLWKDFYVEKTCSVPTPALDEFCKEYLSAAKEKKKAPVSVQDFCSSGHRNVNMTKNIIQRRDVASTDPPSHHYFFHDDVRIQSLVRSRLPYFCPLGASIEAGNMPHNASNIDYMCQFSHEEGAKKRTGTPVNGGKSSRRAGKRTKKTTVENAGDASGEWINPKQTANSNTPKDAGKRRVSADGQSAGQSSGHWFTGENGKKVYVTKRGKELTGQLAYRHYRKESGKTFSRSKKKSTAKKKK